MRDRPFPLDLVPRTIPGEEWRSIKRGLAQRIRALNAFVDDVYHAREIVHEGIVPWERAGRGVRARRARRRLLHPHVPEMIRFCLGEDPILQDVRTYGMADPEQRHAALERLDKIVVKPVDESGGKGVFIGPGASDEEIARQAEEIRRRPERWVAQELVQLSTCPTAAPGGELLARHVDLRPLAVFGDDIHIVPGGLTRVALVEHVRGRHGADRRAFVAPGVSEPRASRGWAARVNAAQVRELDVRAALTASSAVNAAHPGRSRRRAALTRSPTNRTQLPHRSAQRARGDARCRARRRRRSRG